MKDQTDERYIKNKPLVINKLNWSLRFTEHSPRGQYFTRLHSITYLSPVLFQTSRHLLCARAN